MKKILSLALAAAMMVSAIPAAYAAEGENTYDNNYEGQMGTTITLNGSGTEEWTVTVPAKMVPGDTGTVKAEGTWAADKFLAVQRPSSVTLAYGAQTLDVSISGGTINLIGNSVEAVSKEVEISVEDASRLFGTWEGILVYQVDLIHKGDCNLDGVIDDTDLAMIKDVYLENTTLTDDEVPLYDVNGDGKVSALDYNVILNAVKSSGTAATE